MKLLAQYHVKDGELSLELLDLESKEIVHIVLDEEVPDTISLRDAAYQWAGHHGHEVTEINPAMLRS